VDPYVFWVLTFSWRWRYVGILYIYSNKKILLISKKRKILKGRNIPTENLRNYGGNLRKLKVNLGRKMKTGATNNITCAINHKM